MGLLCGPPQQGGRRSARAEVLANHATEPKGLSSIGHAQHGKIWWSTSRAAVLACLLTNVGALDYTAVQNRGAADPEVVAAAQAARSKARPQGPHGEAAAHVFTFADRLTSMLCHLARTVEAAGAWLHILGLRDGSEENQPWGEVDPDGSFSREEEFLHFSDKAVMLKKHLFLSRAIRDLPPNATVIFVDGFDVLFQRPLNELVAAYREIAGPFAARAGGTWPVLFGGEKNCWPFPHNGRVPVYADAGSQGRFFKHIYRVPTDSFLSAGHHGTWRYPYGDKSPWSIRSSAVCSEWLSSARNNGSFPFLCAGTFMGTATALRRLLRRLFMLFVETREYHDQALLALLLLRNSTLGLVDTAGKVFLGLHGHDQFQDLERPLCQGNYFTRHSATHSEAQTALRQYMAENQVPRRTPTNAPVRGYEQVLGLEGFRPPRLRGETTATVPSVLHFNGNGKRHMMRCVEEFRGVGLLGGWGQEHAECTFYDSDRAAWVQLR